MAAFEPEHLGSAADVAVILVEFLQNVVSLVGVAGLVQGRELGAGGAPAAIAVDERRKVLALETGGSGIHDHNALDHITQLTDIPWPGVVHQRLYSLIGHLARTPPVG